MRYRLPRMSWLLIAIVVACLTSCSGGASLNEVQGKVLLKDQPLAGAMVMLHLESGGDSKDKSYGITGADGTFTIKTGDKSGAPAGKYKVSIVCMEVSKEKAANMAMGGEEVDRLKGAYVDPTKSKFSVEVKGGANQLEPFVVE